MKGMCISSGYWGGSEMESTDGIIFSAPGEKDEKPGSILEKDQSPEVLIQEQLKICERIEEQLERFVDQFYREITPETNFYAMMAELSDLLIDIRGWAYELEDLEDAIAAALYPDMDG